MFLIQASGVMTQSTHIVNFASFALTAPQDQVYDIVATCYVGSVVIPAPYHFLVTLSGCPAGMEPSSVTCATCGGGDFSLGGTGGRCTGCPPAGATCIEGILTLKPAYYQPPRQRGMSMGPDSLLYPCYNAEACTLNASTLEYGCAAGYTGALCGVCDAGGGYASFGSACRPCWDTTTTAAAVAVVAVLILAVLTRVALRTSTTRSDASTVLRITMSFIQGVGSLRVFRAGSTLAYQNVMGWTDVVSASPLSVGFLECILRLPYLVQYIATVLMPIWAAGLVVLIFLLASTLRACHVRSPCGFYAADWRAAVVAWWRDRRAAGTIFFVLFLAYMPITSASLRALDCTEPVDGVQYLRTNLDVVCYTGQHAAARALAYIVLLVVGIGFPVGLAWMLGTATPAQLASNAFQASWGILFNGYKMLSAVVRGADKGSTTTGMAVIADRPPRRWHGEGRAWWEGMVLLRKAGVALLAVVVTNSYLQCVGATLWFGGFLLLQIQYTPYTRHLFNRLELASLTASVLTSIVSTALLQDNVGVTAADLHSVPEMTPIEWVVTVLLAAVNMGTLAVLVGFWIWLQCGRVRNVRILRRGSIAAPAGGAMSLPPPPPLLAEGLAAGPYWGGAKGDDGQDVINLRKNPMLQAASPTGARMSLPGTGTSTAVGFCTAAAISNFNFFHVNHCHFVIDK